MKAYETFLKTMGAENDQLDFRKLKKIMISLKNEFLLLKIK